MAKSIKEQEVYKSDPRKRAQLDYWKHGEYENPYPKASVESLEYLSEYQQLELGDIKSAS